MLVIILGMFLFVKCRNRDAFSDKGDYKNISLNGTWYKVDIDDMYVVKFTDENFQEEDVFHEKSNKGTYEVGNHAMKINNKVYSMKYVNEKSDYEDMLDENEGNYDLKNYFYVIDNQGNKIYYFKKEDVRQISWIIIIRQMLIMKSQVCLMKTDLQLMKMACFLHITVI